MMRSSTVEKVQVLASPNFRDSQLLETAKKILSRLTEADTLHTWVQNLQSQEKKEYLSFKQTLEQQCQLSHQLINIDSSARAPYSFNLLPVQESIQMQTELLTKQLQESNHKREEKLSTFFKFSEELYQERDRLKQAAYNDYVAKNTPLMMVKKGMVWLLQATAHQFFIHITTSKPLNNASISEFNLIFADIASIKQSSLIIKLLDFNQLTVNDLDKIFQKMISRCAHALTKTKILDLFGEHIKQLVSKFADSSYLIPALYTERKGHSFDLALDVNVESRVLYDQENLDIEEWESLTALTGFERNIEIASDACVEAHRKSLDENSDQIVKQLMIGLDEIEKVQQDFIYDASSLVDQAKVLYSQTTDILLTNEANFQMLFKQWSAVVNQIMSEQWPEFERYALALQHQYQTAIQLQADLHLIGVSSHASIPDLSIQFDACLRLAQNENNAMTKIASSIKTQLLEAGELRSQLMAIASTEKLSEISQVESQVEHIVNRMEALASDAVNHIKKMAIMSSEPLQIQNTIELRHKENLTQLLVLLAELCHPLNGLATHRSCFSATHIPAIKMIYQDIQQLLSKHNIDHIDPASIQHFMRHSDAAQLEHVMKMLHQFKELAIRELNGATKEVDCTSLSSFMNHSFFVKPVMLHAIPEDTEQLYLLLRSLDTNVTDTQLALFQMIHTDMRAARDSSKQNDVSCDVVIHPVLMY